MTALAANLDLQTKDGVEIAVPIKAAEIIYEGAPVVINSSGYAYSPDGTTNNLTVGDMYAGIATEKVDNSAGAAGDKYVKVLVRGLVRMPVSGTLTQAKLGYPVFVNGTSDDSTLTLTSDLTELEFVAGVFVQHDTSTHGWVDISRHAFTRVGSQPVGAVSPQSEGYGKATLLKFTYDFAVDGGAVGTINIGHVPNNVVVLGAKIDIRTTLTSGGMATIALTLNSAGDIKAATAVASWSAGNLAPETGATFGTATVKTTAARNLGVVIATADLTAGAFDVYLLVANA